MRVSERMLGESIPGGRLVVSQEGRTKWRRFTHPKQWGSKNGSAQIQMVVSLSRASNNR